MSKFTVVGWFDGSPTYSSREAAIEDYKAWSGGTTPEEDGLAVGEVPAIKLGNIPYDPRPQLYAGKVTQAVKLLEDLGITVEALYYAVWAIDEKANMDTNSKDYPEDATGDFSQWLASNCEASCDDPRDEVIDTWGRVEEQARLLGLMPPAMVWKCFDEGGNEYKEGDELIFDSQPVTIIGFEPPHREGASGRVTTTAGRFYAHVYGLHFEEREES